MCSYMSLKLLTEQSRLVEALAGMYMKSVIFLADEGRGQFTIAGAPQARIFLPCALWYYSDVVMMVVVVVMVMVPFCIR